MRNDDSRRLSQATREDRRCRRALAAGTLLVLWGLITHGTYAGSGDEPHYQMIAHSIAFDADVDLKNNYDDRTNLIFAGGLTPGAHAIPGKDGHLRPVHDIGLPLIFSPYFALAYQAATASTLYIPEGWMTRTKLNGPLILRHLLSLAMSVVAVWIALQLFSWFRSSASPRVAAGWAALLVLSPPLLSHAFLFFTEVVSAALALWVFGRLRHLQSARQAALIGIVTGGMFLIHARNVGLIAGLVGVLMYHTWPQLGHVRSLSGLKSRPPCELIGFCAGFAVAIAARTAITYQFWGTWLITPHAKLGTADGFWMLVQEAVTRLLGLLMDQEHGLLIYAPIYLLLPAGFWVLWNRNRELCVELTIVAVAYIAVIALPVLNPYGWRGGWTPAARFLVPVIPFLAIFAFFGGHALLGRFRWAVGALITLQVVLDGFLWQHPRLLWNDGDGVSALLGYFDGSATRLSSLFPSIPETLSRGSIILFGAMTFIWVAATLLLAKTSLEALPTKGARS